MSSNEKKSSVEELLAKRMNQLLKFKEETKQVSDSVDSVVLISSNIFGLFSDTKFRTLLSYLFTIETTTETIKREVIFLSRSLDNSDLLKFLDGLPKYEMQRIGPDFFNQTLKRISKNQSIETFSKLLFILLRNLGFHSSYFKTFFSNDRDIEEVEVFLKYVSNYNAEAIGTTISYLVTKVIIIALEKLSLKLKVNSLLPLLINRKEVFLNMEQTEVNRLLSKVFVSFIQSTLARNDFVNFKKIIDFFNSIKFQHNEVVCNKVLESLNKTVVDDSIIEYFLNYMRETNVTPNIVSFNTVMDYYVNSGKFQRALEIYESVRASHIKCDNYTYTILIKGMKSTGELKLELIEKLINDFKELGKDRDVIIYNSFIDVLIHINEFDRATQLYKSMSDDPDIKPDQVTINTLIKGTCKMKGLESALSLLKDSEKLNIKPNRITFNSLMDMACKSGDMKQALSFLESMKSLDIAPDGYTYSIVINGLKINNSPHSIVRETITNIKSLIQTHEFKLDEIFFNSVMDVCSRYDFYDLMKEYYEIMKSNRIPESSITYGILIKAFGKSNDFENAQKIFEKMLNSNMVINEMTYGCILDACAKSGRMDVAMKIFESLKNSNASMNSIVFTTIIKGYMNNEAYDRAILFFDTIKGLVDLPGMIISFNCMLDLYVRMNNLQKAEELFEEIDTKFKADVISYSTIIKGLCNLNRKDKGFEYIKRLVEQYKEDLIDISVINLYLDSCANVNDFKLGIQVYQFVMTKNIVPNEITFGIMIKIYGFAKELQKAFDLLELMEVYQINPSIIVYTNLIHISFYNKNPKKAEMAFLQFKRNGGAGDKLMYSKLVEGLIRFRETSKLMEYVELALEENCTLKPEVINMLEDIYADDQQDMELLRALRNVKYVEKNVYNNAEKVRSKLNVSSTAKFKAQVNERNKETKDKVEFQLDPPKQKRGGFDVEGIKAQGEKKPLFKEREVKESTKSEHKSEYSKKQSVKKPATLFNFRQNAKKDES